MGDPLHLVRTHKVEVRMTTKHWWFEIRKKCGVHQDAQEPTAVLLFKFHIWTHCGGTFTGPSFVLPQRNRLYPRLKRTSPPPLKRCSSEIDLWQFVTLSLPVMHLRLEKTTGQVLSRMSLNWSLFSVFSWLEQSGIHFSNLLIKYVFW